MSQSESPMQFGLRVAREWYSGDHGDLAALIAREVEARDARTRLATGIIESLGLGVVYGPDEQPDPSEGEPSAVIYEHEEGHFLLRVPEAAELMHAMIYGIDPGYPGGDITIKEQQP